MFWVHRNGHVVGALYYKRNHRKMTMECSFSYNSFVKFCGKKNIGGHNITVLYPNLCYSKLCYKGTALYFSESSFKLAAPLNKSEYEQKMPQSHTADQPTALQGRNKATLCHITQQPMPLVFSFTQR